MNQNNIKCMTDMKQTGKTGSIDKVEIVQVAVAPGHIIHVFLDALQFVFALTAVIANFAVFLEDITLVVCNYGRIGWCYWCRGRG